MIEYIVRHNIDTRVILRTANLLQNGGIVVLPTDTTWVAACVHDSKKGIERLRAISGERDERHFTLLCSNIAQFGSFCAIDTRCYRIINKYTPGPYVFILRTLHGTEKILGLRRSELGVRIPDHPVPLALIEALGRPLYSITAKRSMSESDFGNNDDDANNPHSDEELPQIPEQELFENGYELEDIKGIDIVLDCGEDMERRFSTILDLKEDEARVLRTGAGEFPA